MCEFDRYPQSLMLCRNNSKFLKKKVLYKGKQIDFKVLKVLCRIQDGI